MGRDVVLTVDQLLVVPKTDRHRISSRATETQIKSAWPSLRW